MFSSASPTMLALSQRTLENPSLLVYGEGGRKGKGAFCFFFGVIDVLRFFSLPFASQRAAEERVATLQRPVLTSRRTFPPINSYRIIGGTGQYAKSALRGGAID